MHAPDHEARVPFLDRIFAAVYDPMMRSAERAGLTDLRAQLLGDLQGHVVELGAGTGANLVHYGGQVDHLTLLEPSAPMARRLRDKVAAGPGDRRVEVLEAAGEALPLPDASADAVVSTLVLCTVEDVDRTLTEVRRVLRPGGRLHLIEHVGGAGALRRVQGVLNPIWNVVARGCHLTRDTSAALERHGFDVGGIDPVRLPLPGPARTGVVGTAPLA